VSVDTSALTAGGQLLGVDGTAANVNGARRQQNSFYLDGTDNSGSYRNLGLQTPNPEAIQEVQVTTSTNTAEFGKQPGGYFNVITRSGTNKFDGAVFYFGTDESLNANEWSRNKAGLDRPPSNRKQYGAVLGGDHQGQDVLLHFLPALLRAADPDVLDGPVPDHGDAGWRLLGVPGPALQPEQQPAHPGQRHRGGGAPRPGGGKPRQQRPRPDGREPR
jgi:hypothetical protein